jgi:hypothetical protein
LDAVRGVSGCDDLVEKLAKEQADAEKRATDNRPLGARLDSAKARELKLKARIDATAKDIERLQAKHAELIVELAAAAAERRTLEETLAQSPVELASDMSSRIRTLLDVIESCGVVSAGTLSTPQPLLDAVAGLRELVPAAPLRMEVFESDDVHEESMEGDDDDDDDPDGKEGETHAGATTRADGTPLRRSSSPPLSPRATVRRRTTLSGEPSVSA